MNSNLIPRARFIIYCTVAFAFIILCRLFFIQILNGSMYEERAQKQYIKPISNTIERGSIYFSQKNGDKIAVAGMKEGYNISINPKFIKNNEQVYNALSQYIDIEKEQFISKTKSTDSPYFELLKRVDSATGQSIALLRIPGVTAQRESWRVYPGDELASNTIGLTGENKEGKVAGRYGLESYYENVLSRKNNASNLNFFAELFSDIKKTVLESKNTEGDIVSSIEPTIQSYLEKTLSDTANKWKSDKIGGIIMDPKTGEIYAMAQIPSFNPNNLSNIKDVKVLSNRLVEDSYEMGSIIKPLTMAVGIETGAVNEKSTYKDDGSLVLNGRKISNHDGKAHGITTMQDVLSQSLNVGAATIAQRTGYDIFSDYFFKLGMGEKTGIDQPNEQKGLVKNLTTKRDVEIATASYGQGISLTPVQTIRALSVLANGGLLIRPHVIKEIEYTDGNIEKNNSTSTRIFSKNSIDSVTNMLIELVDKALKNGQVKMEHYSIAAKTGTAQIADPVNGGYYKDRYLHSFFGYFPAYNPKFIVFIYHTNPKGAEYASETLTDPFMQLTKLLINYYEIAPDR